MEQLELFTSSPINIARLRGQNKRLYDYFLTGASIYCFHPAMKRLRIGYLNSRCADLIHKNQLPINKQRIMAADMDGNLVSVVEYSMELNKTNGTTGNNGI